MTKVEMTPIELLKWIKFGIENGRYEAAINIINDAIIELEEYEKENEINRKRAEEGVYS